MGRYAVRTAPGFNFVKEAAAPDADPDLRPSWRLEEPQDDLSTQSPQRMQSLVGPIVRAFL